MTDKAGNSSAVSNFVTVTVNKTLSATPLLVKAAQAARRADIAGLVQTDGSTSRYDVTLYLAPSCTGNVPGRPRSSAWRPSRSMPPVPGPSPSTLAAAAGRQLHHGNGNRWAHLQSGFATCVQVGASNDSWPNALDIDATAATPIRAPGYTIDHRPVPLVQVRGHARAPGDRRPLGNAPGRLRPGPVQGHHSGLRRA